uniref:Innexin n=1 Tax=Dugesia japonica TaxID=6161 RepID=Q2L6M9_DUGJA|nr:innexin5 [Dugesia japonica]
MESGIFFRIGQLFRVPYGGEGVDFVDQLNYQFTSGLLIVFIIIIGIRQYVGKPIQCWVPQEFTRSWEEYAENVCWVQNTYFLLPHEDVPNNEYELSKVRYISYYQWVAIVLAGQAVMSWVPHLIWRVWSRRVPILLRSAREASFPDREIRRKAISCLVAALEEQTESGARFRKIKGIFGKCLGGVNPTARVTLLFIFVRLLFIANNIGQIFMMKKFIGTNETTFGITVFRDLLDGNEGQISATFPRVTYCTIKVRKMGQVKPGSYTLQCVLPINYFVEKVYVFLWFWFIILSILTTLNTVQWTLNVCVPLRRVQFIRQYLKALKVITSTDERDCVRFVRKNLGCDGIFLLQSVSRISSDLIALDVTGTLWNNYKRAKLAGNEDDIHRIIDSVNRSSTVV